MAGILNACNFASAMIDFQLDKGSVTHPSQQGDYVSLHINEEAGYRIGGRLRNL